MYTLLVGSGAITAKDEVAKKRKILTDLQKTKNEIAAQFARLGTRGVKIDDFVAMKIENEDALIEERDSLKKRLEAAGNPELIKAKPELSTLSQNYSVSDDLKAACTSTVTGGSKEAVELIKQHSQNHIHGTPQEQKEFLASSVKAIGSKDATHCPTCGQSLSGEPEELVKALFTIFSNDYLRLRRLVSTESESLERINDTFNSGGLQSSSELNLTRHGEWMKYIESLPVLDDLSGLDSAARAVVDAKSNLVEKLKQKFNDVSILIETDLTAYTAAVTSYSAVIKRYNEVIEEINKQVRAYKSKLDVSQKAGLEKQLIDIENRLLRSSPNAQVLAVDYITNEPSVTNASNDLTTALREFEEAQNCDK